MRPVDGILLAVYGVEGRSLESLRALVEPRLDHGRLLFFQVELMLPLVSCALAFVRNPVALVGDPVALIRNPVALAGNLFAPLDRGQVFRKAVHATGTLLQLDFELIKCAA